MDSRPLRIALGSMVFVALVSCGDGEKKSRGIHYMPEMYNTPAYKSQTAIDLSETIDGKTTVRHLPAMLMPPAGAVSREAGAYALAPNDFAGAKALVNPVAPTAAVLKHGQRTFATICAVCHGLDGNSANGFVAPTKDHPDRFTGVPSLNGANVARLSDGEIYHIITLGRNRMPNYRAQLLPQSRWAVIHYLRALDRASLAVSDAEAALIKLEAEAAEGGQHNDVYAKAELENARAVVAQKKRDLELIKKGGDGAEFEPLPPPVPEYVTPEWPEK